MTEVLDYKAYKAELEERGYRCTHYGETTSGNGFAYYETEAEVLKIEYTWNKVGEDQYAAGSIVNIEDVTACYR